MLTVMPAWYGVYHHQRFDNNKSHDDAVDYADAIIQRTQPTGWKAHLSQMLREKGYVRALTLFRNFMNKQYGLASTLYSAARYADVEPEKKAMVLLAGALALMMNGMWAYLVDRAFVRGLLVGVKGFGGMGEGLEELKDDWGTIARYMVDQPTVGFVLGGESVGYLMQSAYNMHRKSIGQKPINVYAPKHDLVTGELIAGAGKGMEGIIKTIGNMKDEDYEEARRNSMPVLDAAVDIGGMASGLFPRYLYSMGKGALRMKKWGDPSDPEGTLNVFWSKDALENRTTRTAMASRLVDPASWGDRLVFLKWYESLPTKKQDNFNQWIEERVLEEPPKGTKHRKPSAKELIRWYRDGFLVKPKALRDPAEPGKELSDPDDKIMKPVERGDIKMRLHNSGPLEQFASKAVSYWNDKRDKVMSKEDYDKKIGELEREQERLIKDAKVVGITLVPNLFRSKTESGE